LLNLSTSRYLLGRSGVDGDGEGVGIDAVGDHESWYWPGASRMGR